MSLTKKTVILIVLFLFCQTEANTEAQNDFFSAYQHMQKGKYDRAISGFKEVIKTNPEDLPAYSNLALCYETKEMYDQALKVWQKYLSLNPPTLEKTQKHVTFLREMARAKEYLDQNNKENAIACLEEVIKDDFKASPIRRRSLKILGHYYFGKERYNLSLSYYRRFTRDYPKSVDQNILFEYAQSLFYENKFKHALKIYKTLTSTPEIKPYIQYSRAFCLLHLERFNSAQQEFDEFIIEYPDHAFMDKTLLGLGLSLKGLERDDEAIEYFQKICEKHPQSPLISESVYYQAEVYQKKQEHDTALEYYQKIIDQFPNSTVIDDAYYQIGLINVSKEQEEEAIEKFRLITTKYPKSNKISQALYYLAEYQLEELVADPTVDALRYTEVINRAYEIIKNRPDKETKIKAAYLIVESYRNSGNMYLFHQTFQKYLKLITSCYNSEQARQLAKEAGDKYFKEESYTDAGIVYKLITKKYPKTETARAVEYNLAKCYEKKGYYKQALAKYKKLAKDGPESLKATLWSDVADLYRKQGKSTAAVKGYEKALDKYIDLQQYEKAIEECQTLLKRLGKNKASEYLHFLIGKFSYMAHKYPDAEKELKVYLKHASRKKNIIEARILLCLNSFAQYRTNEAIEYLKKIISNYPDYEKKDRLYFLLAYFHFFDYQYPQALSAYQTFIQDYPQSKYQKTAKEIVKKISKLTDWQKQGSIREEDDLNILLISIDTLRADHMHCYGYEKETSPFMDKLAEEGVLFKEATSSSSWTIPSHMSIFTGFYPSVHGVINYNTSLESSRFTLTEYLREQGYRTASFVSSREVESKRGFGQGMHIYDDFTWSLDQKFDLFKLHDIDASYHVPTAPIVCKTALNWLNRNHKQKFFLFVHFMDPHYDYLPPAPYDTMFDPDYQGYITGRKFTSNRNINKDMAKRDLEHILALYDGEIRHTDRYVNALTEKLKELGILDNTLVVLFGDHGDEFFEHGGKAHGSTLYDELIQVPLIMRCPNVIPRNKVVTNQVGTIDILPTVLEILNIPLKSTIQSKSLVTLMNGEKEEENRTIISEVDIHKDQEYISMRQNGYKYIQGKYNQKEELYNLIDDPGEKRNLIRNNSQLAQNWRNKLTDWMKDSVAKITGTGKGKDLTLSEEDKKRLRALGYLQ